MNDEGLASHAQLQQCLQGLALPTGPAEVQALLCGLLCGGSARPRELWLEEILPDGLDAANLTHRQCGQSLAELFQQTLAAFNSSELSFDLLLPPEAKSPLGQRAAELVDWCRGFNYGLGLSGCSLNRLSEEAREGLIDLAEITKLDLTNLSEGEQQEQELVELTEFVRVAVLLIREELAVPSDPSQLES